MTFACVVTVKVPKGRLKHGSEEELRFEYRGRQIKVAPRDAASLDEAQMIAVSCGGFDTCDDAEQFGRRLKGHLRLAALSAGVPMDLGRDQVLSSLAPAVATKMREDDGVQMLPYVHGLLTYEVSELDLVFMVTAEGRASSQAASLFGQALSEVMKLDGAADSTPVGLACDLVSLSSFEGSPRAQFVALVTSLEALVGDPPDSPAAVTGLIDSWLASLDELNGSVSDEDLASLRGRVRELGRLSVSRSMRELVRRHSPGQTAEGESNERFVARCYSVRSQLVHGATPEPDVTSLTHPLRQLAVELIKAVAAGSPP